MKIIDINENKELTITEDTIILSRANKITTIVEENAKVILITLNKDTITKAILKGDNSEQRTISLFKANGEDVNIQNMSEHEGKNTYSMITNKGVIQKSTTTTRGLVKINKDADNSNGYQKADLLVLDDSKVISVPDLEIHNHNVKCSHGSTISQIDEEQKYYLQTRGLSKEQAEKIIIDGFFESTIQELPQEVQEIIKNKLNLTYT